MADQDVFDPTEGMDGYGIEPEDLENFDDESDEDWEDEDNSSEAFEIMEHLEETTANAWWSRAYDYLANTAAGADVPVQVFSNESRDQTFETFWSQSPMPEIAPELKDEFMEEELKEAAENGFADGWHEWCAEHLTQGE